jgi:dolichyl-diphosphooligosaccharide--protein glycosyltransferase/undecaprenyl-diphosphooligosaccharide--protein glycosyltransferase
LRFTVYAVPVAAISAVYLFYAVASRIENRLVRYLVIVGLTGAMLYPNIVHVIRYKVPTVFNRDEVAILDTLSKKGSEKDYVIAWWDYGYPIWYYADKNTLIDGGKHNHDNFIVSEILSGTSQLEAARLSRIAVETYVDSNYSTVADMLFHNGKPDQLDVTAYLNRLKSGKVELPKKTREVYLYLPYRMMNIYPTVNIFSNLDLNTGEIYPRPFFYSTMRFRDAKGMIEFGQGIALDKRKGTIRVGRQEVPVRAVITVSMTREGKMKELVQSLHEDG